VRCHDLVVPQDRADASSGIIRLHVAVYMTSALDRAPEPVVFLAGGPGGAALIDGEDFSLYPFLERRDIVAFDQRGTGHSRPSLDCVEVDAIDPLAFGSALRHTLALGDCRQRLIEDGVVVQAYSSAESAADLADLRATLGIEAWDLYGVSYGTRLALTAMRDHPAGIRAVVLDAVYPPQVDLYADGAQNADRAFEAFFDACATDSACDAAHPRLRDTFYSAVASLDERPLTIASSVSDDEWSVDGLVLIEYLFDRLYLTHVIPSLPATLEDIAAGRTDAIRAYLEESKPLPGLAGDPNDLSDGMHYSIQCQEEIAFTSRSMYVTASRGLPERLVDAFDPGLAFAACDAWGVAPRPPIENEPVTSAIPTLVLAGGFDPITPPEWGSLAVASLVNGRTYRFPRAGHGVLAEDECARSIVAVFLDAPDRSIDAGCLTELRGPAFEP
jgi:pimeloyl-ACP methyl ester carboxylesterase